MSITPLDIQNKEFERAFRGYDIEDVDEFLDRVAKDLENLLRENSDLKEQVSQLQEQNKSYHKMEETMHNAIVVAQETAEEVKHNAKREADLLRREAEREAQKIYEDARHRARKVLSEQEELFKQAHVFKIRFRSFLEAQLAALESEDWIDTSPKEQSLKESQPYRETAPGYEPEHDVEHETEYQPEPEREPENGFGAGQDIEFNEGDDDIGREPEF